jgi:murein DD-endopeptidase MepM/ murein hydrolase activator NlpD
MKDLLGKHTWLTTSVGILIGAAMLTVLVLSASAVAQPTTFLSPLTPPDQTQQVDPFLSVPYYGAEYHTAYFDHEFPNGQINDRIVLYDGRVGRLQNGACGWNNQGQAIAYWTQPGGQGECVWYESHAGNDFSMEYEPVLAATDGTVSRAGWSDWNNRFASYGLHLRITHDSGYETIYGHLSALAVLTNSVVSREQIIGTSGDTGYSSGPHLHFEVRHNGNPVDPYGGAGSDWLWQDGSWNVQGRWVGQPKPTYGAALVVDDDNPVTVGDPNDDPYFAKGRTDGGYYLSCPPDNCPYWWRDTGVGYDGDMLYTYVNGNTTDYWARWQPPQPGLYDVQVWIPSQNGTTWGARYWLVSSYFYMPTTYMVVDQWGASNRWISLGVYQFGYWPSAPWYALWISDATGEGPNAHGGQANLCYYSLGGNWLCRLGVDAIRFRAPWPVYLPLTLKD